MNQAQSAVLCGDNQSWHISNHLALKRSHCLNTRINKHLLAEEVQEMEKEIKR